MLPPLAFSSKLTIFANSAGRFKIRHQKKKFNF